MAIPATPTLQDELAGIEQIGKRRPIRSGTGAVV